MARRFNTTAYRYPNEQLILWLTMLLVLVVIAVTATATVCLSAVFLVGALIISYGWSRSHHRELMLRAQRVTQDSVPGLVPVIQEGAARLQVEPVNVFIVPSKAINAYTFGLDSPKAIVLYSSLLQVMDRDELLFIIGHEMGHVRLGHTWLNSLVGGMAGIPSPAGAAVVLEMALRWWNRACEFSADRAGMLACSSPQKAVSALIKLEAGPEARSQAGLQRAIERIEAEDDDIANNIAELLATHPLIVNRIEKLRLYARSTEYHRLQGLMDQNLS
ncbi:MAG: M48 family metallopeptidase [Anaerolineales bacterium]|nr:M48 family metallopeptidase [Anaerolineales bacterium]